MTLPTVLKIGSAEYRVKLSESLDMFGTTDNRSSKIKIAAWQADDQQRATMMHESLHAVLFCAGAEKLIGMDYDAEERLVSLLEPWLPDAATRQPRPGRTPRRTLNFRAGRPQNVNLELRDIMDRDSPCAPDGAKPDPVTTAELLSVAACPTSPEPTREEAAP